MDSSGDDRATFPGVPPGRYPRNVKWVFAGTALSLALVFAAEAYKEEKQEPAPASEAVEHTVTPERLLAPPDGTAVAVPKPR